MPSASLPLRAALRGSGLVLLRADLFAIFIILFIVHRQRWCVVVIMICILVLSGSGLGRSSGTARYADLFTDRDEWTDDVTHVIGTHYYLDTLARGGTDDVADKGYVAQSGMTWHAVTRHGRRGP